MSDKIMKEINHKKIIRMQNLAKKEKDALSIFLTNVDYLKEKNGWTLERLAEEADISRGTLNSVYYKYCRSVQLYTVEKIAKGFKVSTSDILSEDMVERMEKEELLIETYAQTRLVDDDDKRNISSSDLGEQGYKQSYTIGVINESGLYATIFGSKLESAKKFKKWVTSEVLPSIRKTGSYSIPEHRFASKSVHQYLL